MFFEVFFGKKTMNRKDERPNIIFIMSDDHASHAMSCYGSRINRTPGLDRIADEGIRFDSCFCTNSICTPSRATILTGTYNHVNGVTTLSTMMDNRLWTFPRALGESGYQTAVFGKWHLGEGPAHCPAGFDDWAVLPGQGRYHNPEFIFPGPEGGVRQTVPGYATDIITDLSLDWIGKRDRARPFCLLCHHKAPHRPWYPDEKHAGLFLNEPVPEPETLLDDYRGRAAAAAAARMRLGLNFHPEDLKCEIAKEMPEAELRRWAYQRYIKDYLRVVASIDDNVGRLLDRLEEEGLSENTIIIYTSDQGFFLGDHGWYDKRFMYEESLRMPLIMRWPREIKAGCRNDDMVLNTDFAPFFLSVAGLPPRPEIQGRDFRPLCQGETPADWRRSMYYRYWMHGTNHNVYAHYGVRTKNRKLIYYYADPLDQPGAEGEAQPPEWELFNLEEDPCEIRNLYGDPLYREEIDALKAELHRLQAEVGDTPHFSDTG